MSLFRLAWKNILGGPVRSGLLLLCVVLIVSSVVGVTLIIEGAKENLHLSLDGMADPGSVLVVVPGVSGTNRTGMQEVDLEGLILKLSAVPGVDAASPQQSLMTITGGPFHEEKEIFVVAFDPATDFMVLTRLQDNLRGSLGIGDAIAGSQLSLAPGQQILNLAGYKLKLAGHLVSTGHRSDQSLYISFETARDMAQRPRDPVEYVIDDAANTLPIILIQIRAGSDTGEVAARILHDISGVSVFDSVHFFRTGREQMLSFLQSIPGLLIIIWVLSIVFIALIFSLAANERRREIGILRALGATRSFVLQSLLAEGFLLALGGGIVGAMAVTLVLAFLREEIVQAMGLRLPPSSTLDLGFLVAESLTVAVFSTLLASLYPGWRISRQDPALAMRG